MIGVRLTIDEIKQRIYENHGDRIKLDESTYKNTGTKVRFIDSEYGEFWYKPSHLFNKHTAGHPARKEDKRKETCKIKYGVEYVMQSKDVIKTRETNSLAKWGTKHYSQSDSGREIKSATAQRLDVNVLISKIEEIHGDVITLLPNQTYRGIRQKLWFNDKEYGKWYTRPQNILSGQHHPERGRLNALSKIDTVEAIERWSDKKIIYAHAAYEIAFVKWCNKNQIDFDWQITFKMPNGRKYIVDAFIKTGEFANNYLEIKGWWRRVESKNKWEWFHKTYPNSLIWFYKDLQRIGIIHQES